jgi:hypothetical protein
METHGHVKEEIGMSQNALPQDARELTENCDLCIVGAGAAGLNALFAASKYLTKAHKVILVDKRQNCGGMWNDTYDYVRLHQPHATFTAGNIQWTLNKPPDYLASRTEVVAHLNYCLEQLKEKVTLVEYYGFEYSDHEEVFRDGKYHADLRFTSAEAGAATLRISADRCIKAFGHSVPNNEAIKVASASVDSLSPHDKRLMDPAEKDKESTVYIIGGGKTAMDTAHELLIRFPRRKINLVVGKGTIFINRDSFFSAGIKRWWQGTTSAAAFSDIALRFDGDNESEVLDYFRKRYCIQLDDHFSHHAAGVLSERENEFIAKGIRSVFKDYLSDVVDEDGKPVMVFRSGGRQVIEKGSLIVNCTGYTLRKAQPYEPYLSKHGTVVSIQMRSAIHALSTFAAYYLVHLLYLGKLDGLRLYELDHVALSEKNRVLMPFAFISQVLLNVMLIIDAVPWSVIEECGLDNDRLYPLPRRLLSFLALRRNKQKLVTQCKRALDRVKERTQIRCGVLESID